MIGSSVKTRRRLFNSEPQTVEAPLCESTFEEQRAVIRFLLSEKVKPAEIYRRMLAQYGPSCMNRSSFYAWTEKFRNGRASVETEPRPGRPIDTSTPAVKNNVERMILDDRRVTIEVISEKLGISTGLVHKIIHNDLGFTKTCARWVPKQLSPDHKKKRLEICSKLLKRYKKEGDSFLERIITTDESWVHHYEPETKRQSMSWKHSDSPTVKKFKAQPSSKKVLLTIFWDMKGTILCDYLETQRTINSEYYSNLLKNDLRPAIIAKRKGAKTRGIIFHQDNAPAHTARLTKQTLDELGWELLEHPPYSPDLAPCDFHLFGPLKNALRGKTFANNEEVKIEVNQWLRTRPKEFFQTGIKKLVHRWEKCIELSGDYVEK